MNREPDPRETFHFVMTTPAKQVAGKIAGYFGDTIGVSTSSGGFESRKYTLSERKEQEAVIDLMTRMCGMVRSLEYDAKLHGEFTSRGLGLTTRVVSVCTCPTCDQQSLVSLQSKILFMDKGDQPLTAEGVEFMVKHNILTREHLPFFVIDMAKGMLGYATRYTALARVLCGVLTPEELKLVATWRSTKENMRWMVNESILHYMMAYHDAWGIPQEAQCSSETWMKIFRQLEEAKFVWTSVATEFLFDPTPSEKPHQESLLDLAIAMKNPTLISFLETRGDYPPYPPPS